LVTKIGMRKAASGNGISSVADSQGVPRRALRLKTGGRPSEKEYAANSALDSGVGRR
jgi:hypothetical protein